VGKMTEENKPLYPSLCPVPLMKKERFSELSGFDTGVIEGWLDKGLIPSVKVGKHRAINVVLITSNLLAGLPLDSDDNN
jgi:hypothetical protein